MLDTVVPGDIGQSQEATSGEMGKSISSEGMEPGVLGVTEPGARTDSAAEISDMSVDGVLMLSRAESLLDNDDVSSSHWVTELSLLDFSKERYFGCESLIIVSLSSRLRVSASSESSPGTSEASRQDWDLVLPPGHSTSDAISGPSL